ncbi:hypothetical protein HOLleu_13292 [Holothuria leucospilota]|uniref:Uncharacterized protein n=1 Tax=Holothuria leucospilota TaxID=206669 RepID=A0A9Q1CAT1_HOLLE|nr:hypothetical protein HOLleu_13292 [Holothuria leucospilota]
MAYCETKFYLQLTASKTQTAAAMWQKPKRAAPKAYYDASRANSLVTYHFNRNLAKEEVKKKYNVSLFMEKIQ